MRCGVLPNESLTRFGTGAASRVAGSKERESRIERAKLEKLVRQKHEALLKKRHAYRHKRYSGCGTAARHFANVSQRCLQRAMSYAVSTEAIGRRPKALLQLHSTVSP